MLKSNINFFYDFNLVLEYGWKKFRRDKYLFSKKGGCCETCLHFIDFELQ